MAPRTFTATIEKGEDGFFVARCVETPESISQGKTKEEAMKNIREAIEAVLECRQKKAKGKPTEQVNLSTPKDKSDERKIDSVFGSLTFSMSTQQMKDEAGDGWTKQQSATIIVH